MLEENPNLIKKVRDKFAHIDICPFEGERIFLKMPVVL